MPLLIQSGQILAFLGASITEYGWTEPTGYLHLIIDTLAQNGVAVTPIPAGRGGNKSRDMLARLDVDILQHHPDFLAIDAGRNDVWHGGVPLDEYRRNMTEIVERAQTAGIRVLLQTITPIGEDLDNDFNRQLVPFNQFVRTLAAQKHCALTDLNAAFADALQSKTSDEYLLTVDGTHLNAEGNRLMATGLLKTLGLTDAPGA